MTDPRRLPFNGTTALTGLRGQVSATRFCDGMPARISVPVSDLLRRPGGARDRQLLLGAPVTVIDRTPDWSFVQAECGYVGYVATLQLSPEAAPDHVVSAPATHAYTRPDLKSPERLALPFGARLSVIAATDAWAETPYGHVPRQHLSPLAQRFPDPVTVARMFLGTPYLWGGNSIWGLDCSGLVQTACRACAIPCPGDADMQQTELGTPLPENAALQGGDVVFWRGHVGLMLDAQTLIHANAHAMAVTAEPFATACARISAAANTDGTGGGEIMARRRPIRPTG